VVDGEGKAPTLKYSLGKREPKLSGRGEIHAEGRGFVIAPGEGKGRGEEERKRDASYKMPLRKK